MTDRKLPIFHVVDAQVFPAENGELNVRAQFHNDVSFSLFLNHAQALKLSSDLEKECQRLAEVKP